MKQFTSRLGVVIKQPKVVFALIIADSALTVLNQTTFGLPKATQTAVTLLLAAFAYLGIGPILGPAFKAFVHLPTRVATAISVALLAGTLVVQQDVAVPASAIILAIIQFAGSLGFTPASVTTI